VIATALVSTLAGSAGFPGSGDGSPASARFNYPTGITTDGESIYVADTYNNTIRRIMLSTGEVNAIAGTAGSQGSEDGIGTAARFFQPCSIATDGTNLFVADSSNSTVRKIVISTAVVTTIAGGFQLSDSADGAGALARFNYPQGIATDGRNLYVSDTFNHTIRKIQ